MTPQTRIYRIAPLLIFVAFHLMAQTVPPPVFVVSPWTWPALIQSVEPEYTERAKELRIQGTVLLRIVILADGSLMQMQTRVARSLDPVLDEQAVRAVQQCRFRPATKDGKPVAFEGKVRVKFRLPADGEKGAQSSSEAAAPIALDFSDPQPAHLPAAQYRWKEGAPHCAKFSNNGAVVKSIEAGDLAVYVTLSDMGGLVRAYFIARNRNGEYDYKVDPTQSTLKQEGVRGERHSLNPREYLATAGTHTKVDRALAGTQEALPDPVVTSETGDATAANTKSIADIKAANRQIAELNRAGRTYNQRLADYLVFPERIMSLGMSFGAIYFETPKRTKGAVFSIPIEFVRSVDGGPFHFEFAFRADEIERQ